MFKENANTVIDNTGKIPYINVSGKPATLVENVQIVTDAGGSYYTASYTAGKTLTFRRSTG